MTDRDENALAGLDPKAARVLAAAERLACDYFVEGLRALGAIGTCPSCEGDTAETCYACDGLGYTLMALPEEHDDG